MQQIVLRYRSGHENEPDSVVKLKIAPGGSYLEFDVFFARINT